MSNFDGNFDAEWLVISGEISIKRAKIRPALRVLSILPAIGGLVLAKATSLCRERDLDIEQNGQNQNHQDFSVRLLDMPKHTNARCRAAYETREIAIEMLLEHALPLNWGGVCKHKVKCSRQCDGNQDSCDCQLQARFIPRVVDA